MNDFELNEFLAQQILEGYAQIAELDPTNWQDEKEINLLNRASELDPTGLTTFMLVRGLYDRFLKNTTFTAKEILDDLYAFERKLKNIQCFYGMVEYESVIQLIRDFEQKILGAADVYSMEGNRREQLVKFLGDKYEVANIRLAALRSVADLEVCQFMAGTPSTETLKVNRHIFEFWNINSLIDAMRSQRVDGISMCLIRDEKEVMASYFVFAIRNGENLYILTDRQEGPHPKYWEMARKPARDMVRRWEANWFPYYLLELEPELRDDGSIRDYQAKKRNDLVRYQTEAVRLAPIGSLPPAEFIWASLVFDRIQEEYSTKLKCLPNLSYTGEMVVVPDVLASAGSGIVQAGYYRLLELPALTLDDVSREATENQWETKPTPTNDWVEQRYAKNVPLDILCPIGLENQNLLSTAHGLMAETPAWSLRRSAPEGKLESLSPLTFGTAEKLRRDQQWVGRYNLAVHMQKQLDEEYERELDNVVAWYREQVNRRREFLIETAVLGEFITTVHRPDPNVTWDNVCAPTKANILDQAESGFYSLFTIGGTFHPNKGWSCCINGKPGNIQRRFKLRTGQAIADALGLLLEQLPVFLQNYLWHHDYPYQGNSILRRLDPLNWHINNPWDKREWDITVVFSKSGLKQKRKSLGKSTKE